MLEVHINAPKAVVRQSPSGSSSQVRLDMAPFTDQPPERNGIKLDPYSTSRFLKVLETVILAKSPHSWSWPDWRSAKSRLESCTFLLTSRTQVKHMFPFAYFFDGLPNCTSNSPPVDDQSPAQPNQSRNYIYIYRLYSPKHCSSLVSETFPHAHRLQSFSLNLPF